MIRIIIVTRVILEHAKIRIVKLYSYDYNVSIRILKDHGIGPTVHVILECTPFLHYGLYVFTINGPFYLICGFEKKSACSML